MTTIAINISLQSASISSAVSIRVLEVIEQKIVQITLKISWGLPMRAKSSKQRCSALYTQNVNELTDFINFR